LADCQYLFSSARNQAFTYDSGSSAEKEQESKLGGRRWLSSALVDITTPSYNGPEFPSINFTQETPDKTT
jgi:hypothetical protein